jgi:Na+/H+ antiporter NhaD/arsenite permease-like protein
MPIDPAHLAQDLTSALAIHAGPGREMPLWTVLPFAALLAAIAVLPLVAAHWWERNRNKALVSAVLALPVGAYMNFVHGPEGGHHVLEKLHEYASFVILLGALFVITGGIHVRGSLSGTPLLNTVLLGSGALLANAIGTTGASVLLVRPLLRANAPRKRKAHLVVFFIFIVSNCGGLLTPLGDPPLFLGYLKGVPFEWTLGLLPQWLLVNGILLVVFNFCDQRVFNREERERPGSQLEQVQRHAPLGVDGKLNVLFLAGIVATIYLAGRGFLNDGRPWIPGVQEALMLALTVLSYVLTARAVHAKNHFAFGPIIEVAVLFAGIFITMTPALLVLNAWGLGERQVLGASFGLETPAGYFWATGLLSGFLDNAPTYLTFAATACGGSGIPLEGPYLGELLRRGPEGVELLKAVSCGAVFMGALTYIGNGPNFMVKAIAEQAGVRMPGFFGYMAWSGLVLVPTFVIVTLVFFR